MTNRRQQRSAFLGRLTDLIIEGNRQGHIEDWRNDDSVRQILGHELSKETLRGIVEMNNDPPAISRAVNLLEVIILKEMSLVSSGQRSSLESFENVKQLLGVLASEQEESNKRLRKG